jgi:hypothetical protein
MTNHVLLDNISHKDLKIRSSFGRGQGFDESATRVFPVEFSQLQTEYPIFFTRNTESGHFEPMALLGLTEHENLFLADNAWDARYIPLSVQRQPFLIGFQETMESGIPQRQPAVHIDLDHPRVSMTQGQPVYLEHGGESPLLEHMTSILMTIHTGHEANETFSKLLVGLDLVEPFTLKFELFGGEKINLTGLYTINEDKLRDLNGSALEALHQKGFLLDVYMMLASIPNVGKLIDKKNSLLANKSSSDKP